MEKMIYISNDFQIFAFFEKNNKMNYQDKLLFNFIKC